MKTRYLVLWGTIKLFITLMKFASALLLGSIVVLASFLESFGDIILVGFTLFSYQYAGKAPDWDHRYGHGKIEGLQGLVQSTFMFFAVIGLFLSSIVKIFLNHLHLNLSISSMGDIFFGYNLRQYIGFGHDLLFAVLIIEGATLLYIWMLYRKNQSFVIYTALMDTLQDSIITVAAVITYAIGFWMSIPDLDIVAGFIFVVFFSIQAYRIQKNSLNILLDHEIDPKIKKHMQEIILKVKGVERVHDMRTRHNAQEMFVDFHLELHGSMSLFQAHGITELVETQLHQAYPKINVVIHEEPACIRDEKFR